MTAKRIMLLGTNGQVGQALRAQPLPADWQLGAYGHTELDIANHGAVRTAFEDFKPELIINAAAVTNVDAAEKDPMHALAVNFEAVANIASLCSVRDIPVIHLSTDYVFDGQNNSQPYQPNDMMGPINVYGESKMMGEEALRHELPWHVILRISWVFGAYGNNLLSRMLTLLDSKEEIRITTDTTTCPTPATDVAQALVTIAIAILKGKHGGYGTFQLCGSPHATRLEFTQAVLEAYAPYIEKQPKIISADASEFPNAAPRPAWSVMDCAKIRDVYGIEQKPWREGLAEAMTILMRERRKVA